MENTSKAKKLIQNTMLYTISNFGSKIFVFLIVPIYTYYLSTSEYGEYDTIYSLINLITPICTLAIQEGLLRWLLKSKEKNEVVFTTGFFIYIVLIIITNIILMSIYILTKWQYSFMMIFCLSMSTLNEILQFSTRGAKKNVPFAISGIIQTIMMVFLNIIFVIFLKLGVNGMLLSFGISQLTSSIFLIIIMRKYFKLRKNFYNNKLAKEMMLYSIMLVPNNISWWVMDSSDRIMLSLIAGTESTGVYSVATKFPSLLSMVHTIFYRAWQEQAVIEYDSDTRDKYYSSVFNIYMKLVFCLILILIPISKIFIMLFMNTDFKVAYIYIGILMLGTVFSSFSGFYGTGYVSAKETKNATITTMIGALINCILNLAFIKIIGVWAACISTLIGYLVTWIIRIKQTKKYFKIDVNWRIFFILFTISLIYCFINLTQEIYSSFSMLLVALILAVVINKNEIHKILIVIKKKMKIVV